jgi:hypothetical protein
MKDEEYPHQALYCPAREAHIERRERLLAAFSENAIYLHCSEHDWIRIELFQYGKHLNMKGITGVANQVKPKDASGKIVFDLKKIAIHARGEFKVRRRKWREGMK